MENLFCSFDVPRREHTLVSTRTVAHIPNPLNARPRTSAFTPIEMPIAIALIGVLSALAPAEIGRSHEQAHTL